MAEVTARKRGTKWEYRFEGVSIDGKRKQYSKSGFKTKKEALIEGNARYAQYNKTGIDFEPSSMGFSDYMDFFYENYVMKETKRKTQYLYECVMHARLKPYFGKYRLSAISSILCQTWLNELASEGISQAYVKKLKSVMTTALDYAVVPCGFISSNPMKLVYMPKMKEARKKEPPHTATTNDKDQIGASVRECQFDYKRKEFRIQNAMRDCKGYPLEFLRKSLKLLSEADGKLKSSRCDETIILEETITKMFYLRQKLAQER